MPKFWVEGPDEYWPHFALRADPVWPEEFTAIELTQAEFDEYIAIAFAYQRWQTKFQDHERKRKIHPDEPIQRVGVEPEYMSHEGKP